MESEFELIRTKNKHKLEKKGEGLCDWNQRIKNNADSREFVRNASLGIPEAT